jgi:hypothetical protein
MSFHRQNTKSDNQNIRHLSHLLSRCIQFSAFNSTNSKACCAYIVNTPKTLQMRYK